jgi:hypothetical protein
MTLNQQVSFLCVILVTSLQLYRILIVLVENPLINSLRNWILRGNSGGIADALNGVFVKENGSLFLVFDDLKIVPCSLMTSVERLMELGYSDLSKLEEVTHNIGKQEVIVLCFVL